MDRMKYPTDNQIAGLADRLYSSCPFKVRYMQRYRPYICPFQPLLTEIGPGTKLLDIGCGSGLFSALAAVYRGPLEVHGIDTSPTALSAARAMADTPEIRQSGSVLKFFQAADPSGWPNDSYETVVMIDVMHHLPPLQRKHFVMQAFSRLRAGGKFLYKDIASTLTWRSIANQLHDLIISKQWVRTEPLNRVRDWLEESGGIVLKTFAQTRLWYEHEFLIVGRPVP